MTIDNMKRMMDSFYLAKRILEMLPLLPQGVSSSNIRYLDVIERIKAVKGFVRVSDLSEELSVQRPGVTRFLSEMEEKGYIKKIQSDTDRRVTYIEITKEGEALSKKYNEETFVPLLDALSSVTDDETEKVIEVINKFYKVMKEEEKYNG